MWDNLYKVLKDYGEQLASEYKDNLRGNDRQATGNLVSSVKYKLIRKDSSIEVDLSLADYWKWVENDTRPHFPPVDKIAEWVKAKPILPTPDENGKLPTEQQLAFLIARKISIEGTEGTHDLETAVDSINTEFEDRISEAITKDIEDSVATWWNLWNN